MATFLGNRIPKNIVAPENAAAVDPTGNVATSPENVAAVVPTGNVATSPENVAGKCPVFLIDITYVSLYLIMRYYGAADTIV